MSIYLISGKLGSGKTLASVGRIRDALLDGRPVATNLDLSLEHLLPQHAGDPFRKRPVRCMRLPDKPTIDDLELIGSGNDSMDESKNGLIVLDELAVWLNSRTFNDKSRMPVIDWLLHSRKKGWDVYFICQHLEQIDKQIRQALVEYLVVCRRMDRMKIPFIGGLLGAFSFGLIDGHMPKVHVAIVRYGTQPDAIKADTWIYQGKDLYRGYNTRQIFSDGYSSGVFSFVSPWHLCSGRVPVSGWRRLYDFFFSVPKPVPLKPKHPLVEKLSKLDPDAAIRHWRRLNQLGAF